MARPVCSECGADLMMMRPSCEKCGAPIEWESKPAEQQRARSGDVAEPGVCDVCGHENSQAGMYCESCGARLVESVTAGTVAAEKSAKGKKSTERKPQPEKGRKKGGGEGKRKVDPFVIGAAVVVVAIVGYFAYSEIARETPRQQQAPHDHESHAPETASMMNEVERLQGVVDANPNDAASLLRLGNTLHDLSLHDARLLLRAINTYERYLVLRPDDPNARVDLGIVYFELARVDSVNARQLVARAIREMETVASAHPDHQPAAFNLGIVNLNSGNMEESAKWFKKAIAINANSDLGARAQRLLEQHLFSVSN